PTRNFFVDVPPPPVLLVAPHADKSDSNMSNETPSVRNRMRERAMRFPLINDTLPSAIFGHPSRTSMVASNTPQRRILHLHLVSAPHYSSPHLSPQPAILPKLRLSKMRRLLLSSKAIYSTTVTMWFRSQPNADSVSIAFCQAIHATIRG